MAPIKIPFSPGAGSTPPELAGRAPVLEQARYLLGRTLDGKSEKSLMLRVCEALAKPCSSGTSQKDKDLSMRRYQDLMLTRSKK